jgi:hypothetical protein
LRDQVKPEDFTDPLFQRAAQRIFDSLDEEGRLDVGALLRDGDEELKSLISYYTVLEREDADQEKSCKDCVDFIKQQDPEKKMKSLIKTMQDAEARGDTAAIARLTEEQAGHLRF